MTSGSGASLSRPWLALVAALLLHVIDEAATGFLDFYNPLVRSIGRSLAWFPAPTFSFRPWLAGLLAAVCGLALLTPIVGRADQVGRVLSFGLGTLMLLNGAGHLVGSAYFGRWLPGATSAPLLLAASGWLLIRTRQSARAGG